MQTHSSVSLNWLQNMALIPEFFFHIPGAGSAGNWAQGAGVWRWAWEEAEAAAH